MDIRPYSPSDRDACLEIFDSNLPLENRHLFATFLDGVPAAFFVAENNNEIVACGWVEKGAAPDEVIAHHLVKEQNYLGLPRLRYPLAPDSFDRTRPVYPYPAIARYRGKGDTKQEQQNCGCR